MARHKKDIFQIFEPLEKAKEEIHRLLKDFARQGLAEKEDSAFAVMEDVLKEIGKGLYSAAKNYAGREDGELKFYFYPGYTTLTSKRVLIKGGLIPNDERDKPMLTGIGFFKGERFFNCPSTLYYDAIIKDLAEAKYLGPTTHHWKRQQHESIDIKLKDKTPLKILLIESSDENKSKKSRKGLYHLQFNSEEVENVVKFISSELSPRSGLHKISDKAKKYIEWPLNKPSTLSISDERFKLLAEVQRLVYPVWFAATFSDLLQNESNHKEANHWLSSILAILKDKGFYQLAERIERFRNYEADYLANDEKEYKAIFFSHWYSLFFDTKETSHKQELGSAMILTDEQLPEEFLFYASTWLQHIYGLMRLEEHAIEVERNTWKKNFTKLSHSQNQYFEAMKVYVESSSIGIEERKILLHYHELLQGFLEVAKNFDDLDSYVASKGANETIELFSELQDSIDIIKLLFTNREILKESFKLNSEGEYYLENFKNGTLFTGNFISTDSLKISTNKEMFKLLLKDLLVNAIENCDESNPIVEILITKQDNFAILKISNNNTPTEQELVGIVNPNLLTGKYGLQIVKALKTALGWEMSFPTNLGEMRQTNKFYFEFRIPMS